MFRKVKTVIGLSLFMLGICMGDSENLLFPVAFLIVGALLAKGALNE